MTEPDIAAAERGAILEQLREPGSAIAVDWTFERYLAASDFTSRSDLETLRLGPAVYYAKRVAGTIPDKRSPAMEFGSHVHTALLEPEEWTSRLYPQAPLRPAGANGGAKKKDPEGWALYGGWRAACTEWEQGQTARSIIVDPDDLTAIESIAESVRAHPICEWAFRSEGANEQTILWHHESGMLLRCRLDRLLWHDSRTAVIADLKTTADPSPDAFSKAIARLGYHRQAAFYMDAVKALRPSAEVFYELIAVRSTPPYETACYSLIEEPPAEDGAPIRGSIELGRQQYTESLHELARRRRDNDWLSDWQRQSFPITLPPWAFPRTSS